MQACFYAPPRVRLIDIREEIAAILALTKEADLATLAQIGADEECLASRSCAGLIRASIFFAKSFCKDGWIAGSSPAMTTLMRVRRAQ